MHQILPPFPRLRQALQSGFDEEKTGEYALGNF